MSDIEVLGPTIWRMLEDARLDPALVCQLIQLAIDEDLDGGVDVTTVATVPEGQQSILDFVARKRGSWQGCRSQLPCS